MYKNILIATDGSDLAEKAVSHGLSLAKEVNATVSIVTVSEIWSIREIAGRVETGTTNPIEDYEKMEAAWANKVLTAATDKAKEIGKDCETIHVKDQHPAEGIIETAKPNKAT